MITSRKGTLTWDTEAEKGGLGRASVITFLLEEVIVEGTQKENGYLGVTEGSYCSSSGETNRNFEVWRYETKNPSRKGKRNILDTYT